MLKCLRISLLLVAILFIISGCSNTVKSSSSDGKQSNSKEFLLEAKRIYYIDEGAYDDQIKLTSVQRGKIDRFKKQFKDNDLNSEERLIKECLINMSLNTVIDPSLSTDPYKKAKEILLDKKIVNFNP
jgi:hypothetical protein